MRRGRSARLAWTALLAACAPGCYVATVGGLVDDDAGRDAAPEAAGDVVTCDASATLCSGACVDTQRDPGNCGACGTSCARDEVCTDGACTAVGIDAGDDDAAMCAAGLVRCGASCVDIQRDPLNCGACGDECSTGMACSSGACTMTPPDAGMDVPVATMCTMDSDCTMVATGSVCLSGECSCASGETDCSGTCVTLTADPLNCGACGTRCMSGSCAMGVCR